MQLDASIDFCRPALSVPIRRDSDGKITGADIVRGPLIFKPWRIPAARRLLARETAIPHVRRSHR
jgi:hypothetical protein